MSPLVKGLLACALTLPLVVFVADGLASPDPVDPDRSRPVIIGRVNDDRPVDKPNLSPSREDEQPTKAPRDPGDDADESEGDKSGNDTAVPAEEPGGDVIDDQPYTVVTPSPRDLGGDGEDGDNGGDNGDDNNSGDRGDSGDD